MMNRTDAATILNIDPSASSEEARKAYQELFTEHQFRLTNAPTAALRSLYQGRLRELDEARDVLLAAPPADATSDLPTDQPSIPDKAPPDSPREPAKPPEKPAPEPPRQAPKPPEPAIPRQAPKSEKPGRTRNIRIALAIAVVLVIFGLVKLGSGLFGGNKNASDSARAAEPSGFPGYADSLRAIREDITVARLEFNRSEPDYATINKTLGDADRMIASLPASANADTTVARLKTQLAQQRASVNKSCDMLKRIASQRGEATPNCGS